MAASPAPAGVAAASSCGSLKKVYNNEGCCHGSKHSPDWQIVPVAAVATDAGGSRRRGNYCAAAAEALLPGFNNVNCTIAGVKQAVEQAGADVSVGYTGSYVTTAVPITTSYLAAGLCPVNVHWHLGAEHRSEGQFDEKGSGPGFTIGTKVQHRRLAAGKVRLGLRCHKYDSTNPKFTQPYSWQHCVGMKVGETYEVHWPHSALGACGTVNQYQSPFYDGVFCFLTKLKSTNLQIGVQAQVFTIVNDENYYYPNLMRGMIIDGDYGTNITHYTGSTTGTSRSNTICSKYAPITWQVDRICHLISASTFDKMCADMKNQRDDMSMDLYPHGARELVSDAFSANNQFHPTTNQKTPGRLLEGDDESDNWEEASDDKPEEQEEQVV
jgi:hypothetical protein